MADDLGASSPLAPPLYPSSVYTMPDLDAYERIMSGEAPGFYYARDGHPNARRLAQRLAALEGGAWGVMGGSGMAAISALLLATLRSGDRVVAGDRLYGRAAQLLRHALGRFGVPTEFLDLSDLESVEKALKSPARLLYAETISNPMLQVVDLERLAALAHEHGCLFAADNTFATPVLTRPLEIGADFVVESLTKMIGGHSDVTLGAVCGRGDQCAEISKTAAVWGLSSSPFDCWLAERGLETLPLRMRAASANAAALADWLANRPGVTRDLPRPAGPPRPRHSRPRAARRLRQHAVLRAGRRPRRREPLHAPGARHPVQPIAGPHGDDVQPPGDDIAPFRRGGGKGAAGHRRRVGAAVGGVRGFGADSGGNGRGIGVSGESTRKELMLASDFTNGISVPRNVRHPAVGAETHTGPADAEGITPVIPALPVLFLDPFMGCSQGSRHLVRRHSLVSLVIGVIPDREIAILDTDDARRPNATKRATDVLLVRSIKPPLRTARDWLLRSFTPPATPPATSRRTVAPPSRITLAAHAPAPKSGVAKITMTIPFVQFSIPSL